jgi:hypothetical protein
MQIGLIYKILCFFSTDSKVVKDNFVRKIKWENNEPYYVIN